MAQSSKPATGTKAQSNTEQREDTRNDAQVDVVAMPSIKADGTPDQTKGFKTVGEDQDS